MIIALAFLMGLVAGLRSMTALAAVSMACWLGFLPVADTALAALGYVWTPWIVLLFAAAELVADKSPRIPSRTRPIAFGGRLLSAAVCGAAIGLALDAAVAGLSAAVVGAIVGTLGGIRVRTWLADRFGHNLPAALMEDIIAILLGVIIVLQLA